MAVAKGQLVLHGVHMDGGKPIEPATYVVDWPALADDAKYDDGVISIDADYDFELLELTHTVSGVAAGADVKLKIQAQMENGRPWFINPVYINGVSALQDAGQPRKLPVKRRIPRTKKIKFNFYEATSL